jgi:hypothetical protein
MAKGKLKGKIKKAIGKVKDKTKSTVKYLKDNGGYAPLLPFKAIMVASLKKKGEDVKMSTPMSQLAPLFRDVIIKKNTKRNYADLYLENVVEDVVSIVRDVLDYIKGLSDKKKNNQPLTEEEREIFLEGEKVAREISEKGTKAGGNWFADNKVIIIGAAAVILFLAFRKK